MEDKIEKSIELKAPIARVWQALIDYQEFGQWFRVKLDGPFAVGEISHGWITYPGYEHLEWNVMVKKIEPQRLFSFTWTPYETEPTNEAEKPEMLVEFRLEETAVGTHLTVTESGFLALPDDPRRIDAFRSNDDGWQLQMKNIQAHVES